jgi:hypothetical protein
MSRFPRWRRGGRNSVSAAQGLQPQFPRDKRIILSKKAGMFRPLVVVFAFVSIAYPFGARAELSVPSRVIISVHDQKLMLLENGARVATYPVSTSKFGLGDGWGRMTTPLGFLQVAQKIGDHAPTGAVFHNRRFTGEVLLPNAPGRDPIITRIIWLRGLEAANVHAFNRCIYIHGTPQEKTIGRPASYGCIRMKSSDVTALYSQLPLGALVQIVPDRLPKLAAAPARPASQDQPATETIISSTGAEKSVTTPGRKSVPVPLVASSGRGA